MGDELVHLEPALLVVGDEALHLRAALDAAEGAALPYATGDQLECCFDIMSVHGGQNA